MAHVVGVPKRDPCKKCQLPVFLAERLAIGKKVYHRTCLKCARCGSQLTPGSFYETEVDNEYCCETCPDEEIDVETGAAAASSSSVLLRTTSTADDATNTASTEVAAAAAAAAAAAKARPSSIANRLAFFEQGNVGDTAATTTTATPDIRLLQKSVSDEEKTQSLKRMEASAAASAPYKMNTAFSSFISDTIEGNSEAAGDSEPSSTTEDKSGTHMDTSDSEADAEADLSAEVPPALPTTPAPEVQMRSLVAAQPASKRFTATAQLQLVTTTITTDPTMEALADQPTTTISEEFKAATIASTEAKDAEDNVPKVQTASSEKKKTEIQLNLVTTTNTELATANKTIDNANNNSSDAQHAVATPAVAVDTEESTHKLTEKSVEINLELSATNDNDKCVTKDKIADTDIIMDTDTFIATAQSADSTLEIQPTLAQQQQQLEQQQVLLATENVEEMPETVELRTKTPTSVPEQQQQEGRNAADAETTERLSVVRARLQQFEVIANKRNNNDNDNAKAHTTSPDKVSLSNSNTNTPSIKPEKHVVQTILIDEATNTEPKSMPQENLIDELQVKTKASETEPMEITTVEAVASIAETITESISEVPLSMEIEDNVESVEKVTSKPDTIIEEDEMEKPIPTIEILTPIKESIENVADEAAASDSVETPTKIIIEEYPEDLNPFKSDDEAEEHGATALAEKNKENVTPRPRTLQTTPPNSATARKSAEQLQSSNPFDSSDDEVELEKSSNSSAATTPSGRVPPPRPPPPRISRNPFGDELKEDDDSMQFSRRSSLSSSLNKKTPVPTPRTNLSQSQNPTPEPTPRLSNKSAQSVLQDSSDYYSSANSLSATPASLQRNSDARSSTNSLTSSGGGTIRSRKSRKAHAPPPPPVKELFPSSETVSSGSKASTPSSSTVGSPKLSRKKRPAPAPPKPARLEPGMPPHDSNTAVPKNSLNYPLQSELDSKLSDEEKALLEGKQLLRDANSCSDLETSGASSKRNSRRLIPLDVSLLDDHDGDPGDDTSKCDDMKSSNRQQRQYSQMAEQTEEINVVYRRVLMPPSIDTPTHDRQLEKLKDNKETKNRNRQSQLSANSSGAEDNDLSALYNKSAHGKWKRRKGPAPALPIPPRKVLLMLPLQEIRHELEIIEVQQQGLEKQGVILEKMIRDRCEDENGEPLSAIISEDVCDQSGNARVMLAAENVQNSREVEDLILQLFELVNEKNELFRRQAELMYLRRQHRLEQEQADLEYEIRVLMAQPERNKTDTDKAREEALIARLVEVVQLRNEVIECLEMDRLREAEEDLSIKQRLELHTAQRDSDMEDRKTLSKLSKKEKKKQKEAKKLSKNKKMDADKDADETELQADKQKAKKKKKKFLF